MTTICVTDSEGEELEIEGQVGLPIMESLRDLDNGVLALCGGMCSCATCHCYIEEPWASSLSPREDDELELLETWSHSEKINPDSHAKLNSLKILMEYV